RAEPPRTQRPRRVLARRSAAEVVAGDQDLRAARLGGEEREPRLIAQVGEQAIGEPGLVGALEEARRDDLIGVDVVERIEDRGRIEAGHHERAPGARVRGSVIRPVTAAAAAVIGEARNVRPPRPCRPSKLRLLVLTAYWPGASASPF